MRSFDLNGKGGGGRLSGPLDWESRIYSKFEWAYFISFLTLFLKFLYFCLTLGLAIFLLSYNLFRFRINLSFYPLVIQE